MRNPTQAARSYQPRKEALRTVGGTSHAASLPEHGPAKDTHPGFPRSSLQPALPPSDTPPVPNAAPDPMAPVKKKVCVKCHHEKPVLEFHKNSRSADGLHSYCKDCNRAQALAHIRAEKARKALLRAAKKAAASGAK